MEWIRTVLTTCLKKYDLVWQMKFLLKLKLDLDVKEHDSDMSYGGVPVGGNGCICGIVQSRQQRESAASYDDQLQT